LVFVCVCVCVCVCACVCVCVWERERICIHEWDRRRVANLPTPLHTHHVVSTTNTSACMNTYILVPGCLAWVIWEQRGNSEWWTVHKQREYWGLAHLTQTPHWGRTSQERNDPSLEMTKSIYTRDLIPTTHDEIQREVGNTRTFP